MDASENIKKMLKSGNQTLHLDWLNKYAEGRLSEIEKAAFEDFINESDDYILKTALEGLAENSKMDDLQTIRLSIKNNKTNQPEGNFKFFKIAAILMMVLSITMGYVFINKNYFGDEVLVDNFEKATSESNLEEAPVKTMSIKTEDEIKQIKEEEKPELTIDKPELKTVPKSSIQPEKDNVVAANQPGVAEVNEKVEDYSQVAKTDNINDQPAGDFEPEGVLRKSEVKDKAMIAQKASTTTPIEMNDLGTQKAYFPGGIVEMNKFIKTERKDCMPITSDTGNAIVKLKLKIKSNGKIGRIIVIKSLSKECDHEAIRLVNKMPNWIPAVINGKNVEDEVNVDVNFD